MMRPLPRLALIMTTAALISAAPPAPPRPPRAGGGVRIATRSDRLAFSDRWPAAAQAIAPLGAWLSNESLKAKIAALDAATEDAADAKKDGYPFHAHSLDRSWAMIGATPQLVSLDGHWATYTGGAHGISGFMPMIWDRAAARPIAFTALIGDRARFWRALTPAFCTALDAERSRRRRVAVPRHGKGEFDRCPAIARQSIAPAGTPGAPFSKLRIEIGPYEAGPYVEGEYVIELPITSKLVGLVRSAWRPSFAAVSAPARGQPQ